MKKIDNEIALANLREQLTIAESKNRQFVKHIRKIEKERDASIQFGVKGVNKIIPIPSNGKSEATAVVLCSDWHIEESVISGTVSGLNEYSLEIAQKRAERFWRTVARMVHIYKRDIPIPNIVLWLGGD